MRAGGPLAHRKFRWYWAARAVSLVGDGVAVIALLLLAAGFRHAGPAVGLVLLASSVPRVFGPMAGALADRFDARLLLIGMQLVQAVVYGVLAAVRPALWLLVLLVTVAAGCATVVGATARTVTPRLVPAEELMAANAWVGTAFNLQTVAGPLAGGLLVGAFGTGGAFAVNAASFVISAALLAPLPVLRARRGQDEPRGFLADVADGLRYVRSDRVTGAIVVLLLVGIFFGSLDNVVLVFFSKRILHTGPFGFGALSAGFGVAMVATSVWLATSARHRSAAKVLTGGWLLTGLGLLLTGFCPDLALAIAAQLVAGLGNGLANVGEETLVQRAVPADRLGRVGGVLTAAAFLGSSGSYAVGGAVVSAFSPRTVLIVAGGGLMAVTLILRPAIRDPAGTAPAKAHPPGHGARRRGAARAPAPPGRGAATHAVEDEA